MEVLKLMGSNIGNLNQGFGCYNYGQIVEDLNRKAICKELTTTIDNDSNPLKASIVLQLQVLGLAQMQVPT